MRSNGYWSRSLFRRSYTYSTMPTLKYFTYSLLLERGGVGLGQHKIHTIHAIHDITLASRPTAICAPAPFYTHTRKKYNERRNLKKNNILHRRRHTDPLGSVNRRTHGDLRIVWPMDKPHDEAMHGMIETNPKLEPVTCRRSFSADSRGRQG